MTKLYKLTTTPVVIPEAGTDATDHFILENIGNQNILISLGEGDGCHIIYPKEGFVRAGVEGELKAWAATKKAVMSISGKVI